MNIDKYEKSFSRKGKAFMVYLVLKDKKWCCRDCAYDHVRTTQIAGSGGIKGLRNGGKTRAGLEIESENRFCQTCNSITRQDRWTGAFRDAIPVVGFPEAFTKRALKILEYIDVIEMGKRTPRQLTLDHKLPRIRWNRQSEKEQNAYRTMTDDDIREKFQLLKRSNGEGPNLLKSRACEKCFDSNIRGKPFGINFFYAGNEKWASTDKTDPKGCIGCGWYDFSKWRKKLNMFINESHT